MGILIVIGRLLFALLLLVSAGGHLRKRKMLAGYAASRGLPSAEFFVATGVRTCWLDHGRSGTLAGPRCADPVPVPRTDRLPDPSVLEGKRIPEPGDGAGAVLEGSGTGRCLTGDVCSVRGPGRRT